MSGMIHSEGNTLPASCTRLDVLLHNFEGNGSCPYKSGELTAIIVQTIYTLIFHYKTAIVLQRIKLVIHTNLVSAICHHHQQINNGP
ncbi:hypothetical protein QVD17_06562 [Tagetes erecta]|uniref:Uncharacterized protein n=1 Tax=Tagetes erecta TaxID=13708 RepID=A0AAD8PCB4_TARER|nr:hypothetical protein QVD17_06562 [Tagetes erecta]